MYICLDKLYDYSQSKAYTRDVPIKGNITQHHSGRKIRNNTNPIIEIKNMNQYFPVLFDSVAINSKVLLNKNNELQS